MKLSLSLLSLSLFGLIALDNPASSQLIPDNTLGAENSIVTPQQLRDLISGGAIRGDNLFHSFQEFNVNEGQQVDFANPAGILNILTRVTGVNPSDIFGALGVEGGANLILINPNGINFGANASLNVAGSFVATTAESVVFEDGFEFSAINPEAPPLLTVSLTPGLQFGSLPQAAITNAGLLGVGLGQNLSFFASEIESRGILFSPGGNITLEATGSINLIGGFVVTSGDSGSGDIVLSAGDSVNLDAGVTISTAVGETGIADAGDIIITTGSLSANNGTVITTGNFGQGNGGNINIHATDSISLDGENSEGRASNIFNGGATFGSAGDINITTNSLTLTNGASIGAINLGDGDTGDINIYATDSILLDGESSNSVSVIFNGLMGVVGNAGEINLTTSSLTLTNGTLISSLNDGQGNGGDITINATDSVILDGESNFGTVSLISTTAGFLGEGVVNGGTVEINTKLLSLTNGTEIFSNSMGEGNAGSVIINASDAIILDGESTQGSPSRISSSVFSEATGDGGSVEITTKSLNVSNAANISSNTLGEGNAGSIIINVNDIVILDGSQVSASTFGEGDAGSVIINASDSITLDGEDSQGFNSGVFSSVESEGRGNGGNVEINTGFLDVTNGALISASTLGEGDAGSVIINASDAITLDGEDNQGFNSGVLSSVNSGAIGDGGSVEINTSSLDVTNGAQIASNTFGEGDAGNIIINASDAINLDGEDSQGFGSGVFSSVASGAIGNGGSVEIITSSLNATNGGGISTTTFGEGDAGKIFISASDNITLDGIDKAGIGSGLFSTVNSQAMGDGGEIVVTTNSLDITNGATVSVNSNAEGIAGNIEILTDNLTLDEGNISSQTLSSDGGNITLKLTNLLVLRNNSTISTNAGTAQAGGNGGNIIITSPLVVALPNENSDISANAFTGDGGIVKITSNGIFGIEFRAQSSSLSDITASSELGNAGIVELKTPDTNPAESIANLPETTVALQPLESCRVTQRSASLINTGRGGIPPHPYETLTYVEILEDIQPSVPVTGDSEAISEAHGWMVNEKGKVVLVDEETFNATKFSCGLN